MRQRASSVVACLMIGLVQASVATGGMGALESATDRNGSDFSRFGVLTAEDCRGACAGNERCLAMTFVKHAAEPGGVCWLKHARPDKSASAGMTSAVKASGARRDVPGAATRPAERVGECVIRGRITGAEARYGKKVSAAAEGSDSVTAIVAPDGTYELRLAPGHYRIAATSGAKYDLVGDVSREIDCTNGVTVIDFRVDGISEG